MTQYKASQKKTGSEKCERDSTKTVENSVIEGSAGCLEEARVVERKQVIHLYTRHIFFSIELIASTITL